VAEYLEITVSGSGGIIG